MPGPLTRLRYWLLARRRARQRRDLRTRLMIAWAALHEARRYVTRDRRAERAERDRLVRELEEALRRQVALEEALLDLQAREIPPAS
ncbi:MAG: hypothetical protein ABS84_14980 [Rubrivivax sp. SCN 71-131]|nr:MAG: hypothetical protein ABS84_14980 [Rubrivivax sp. SCN 71-131]